MYSEITTPCFVVNRKGFISNLGAFYNSFNSRWNNNVICAYSVKTNNNEKVMKIAYDAGWHLEVVSLYEYEKVRQICNNANFVVNGTGKADCLIADCIEKERIINLDSIQEVEYATHYAKVNYITDLHLGLRVNFNLKAQKKKGIANHGSRFGICYDNGDLNKAIQYMHANGIKVSGLHMHTSTETRSLEVYEEISEKACNLANEFELDLDYIDIGGGFAGGQYYKECPSFDEYASIITNTLGRYFNPDKTTLILEPGISVITDAVDYITKVVSIKKISECEIVVLDGSTLHINPMMKERKYIYENRRRECVEDKKCMLCGSTCMEDDIFDKGANVGNVEIGDYIVFNNVGAYTTSLNGEFILDKPRVYIE